MSQQINLLQAKGQPQLALYSTVGLVVVGLAGVLVYGGIHSMRLADLRGQLAAAKEDTTRMREAIQKAEIARRAPDGIQAIENEIAQLNARTQLLAPLLASIESGAAGDPQGYSKQLGMLASVPRDDVWVTSVEISPKSSRQMQVAGRAMRNDQAVSYARQLRQTFEPSGIKFNAIELRPEGLPSSTPEKPASVVNFKIS